MVDITALHSRFRQASSFETQEAILLEAIGHFGYDTYIFGAVPGLQQQKITELINITNCKQEWREKYERESYYKSDIAAHHCMVSDEPILWSKMRKIADNNEISYEQRRVIYESGAAGYKVGVTIPLNLSWSLYRFGISFSIHEEESFDGHDKMFSLQKEVLILIANMFFLHIDIGEKVREHYGVTKVEYERLRKLVSGHTQREIAEHEDVSDKAIERTMNKIKERTKVDKPRHAALKLSMLGAFEGDIPDW